MPLQAQTVPGLPFLLCPPADDMVSVLKHLRIFSVGTGLASCLPLYKPGISRHRKFLILGPSGLSPTAPVSMDSSQATWSHCHFLSRVFSIQGSNSGFLTDSHHLTLGKPLSLIYLPKEGSMRKRETALFFNATDFLKPPTLCPGLMNQS